MNQLSIQIAGPRMRSRVQFANVKVLLTSFSNSENPSFCWIRSGTTFCLAKTVIVILLNGAYEIRCFSLAIINNNHNNFNRIFCQKYSTFYFFFCNFFVTIQSFNKYIMNNIYTYIYKIIFLPLLICNTFLRRCVNALPIFRDSKENWLIDMLFIKL